MAFGPLGGHHRATGTAEYAAEWKLMTVPDFSRFAFSFENRLNGFERVGCNQGFVFSLVDLTAPFHDADVNPVCEKSPDGILRPWSPAPALDA